MRRDALGLGRHLGFQIAVQRLQGRRHAVEARGHLAELVVRGHIDPHRKLGRLDLAQAIAQVAQRVDHIHVARVEHDHRSADGQRHHHELKQVEDRRQAGHLVFDRQHKTVNRHQKSVGVLDQARMVHRGAGHETGFLVVPQAFDLGIALPHLRVPGHKQRARGVTVFEYLHAPVKFPG